MSSQGWMGGSGEEFIAALDDTESNCICRETCHPALSELRQEGKKSYFIFATYHLGVSRIHPHLSWRKIKP